MQVRPSRRLRCRIAAPVNVAGQDEEIVRRPVLPLEDPPEELPEPTIVCFEVCQGMVAPISCSLEQGLADHHDARSVPLQRPCLKRGPLRGIKEMRIIDADRITIVTGVGNEDRNRRNLDREEASTGGIRCPLVEVEGRAPHRAVGRTEIFGPRVGDLELPLGIVVPELMVIRDEDVGGQAQRAPVQFIAPVRLVPVGEHGQWRRERQRRRPVLIDLVTDEELQVHSVAAAQIDQAAGIRTLAVIWAIKTGSQ